MVLLLLCCLLLALRLLRGCMGRRDEGEGVRGEVWEEGGEGVDEGGGCGKRDVDEGGEVWEEGGEGVEEGGEGVDEGGGCGKRDVEEGGGCGKRECV